MSALKDEILASVNTRAHALEGNLGYELTFLPGADFIGFRGHFPGHPILPAFVQLLMGQCAMEIRTGKSLDLRRVERAKFMMTIPPEQPVRVCWQEQPSEYGLRGRFTLVVGGGKAAAFTAEFSLKEAKDA